MRFLLADHGTTFATRPRAEELCTLLLGGTEGSDEVIVDLGGVLGVSYSFADEFFGRLLDPENADRPDGQIAVSGGRIEVERVVRRVFERRNVQLEWLQPAS